MTKIINENIVTKLQETLPPVFSRKVAEKSLGHIISARTLANLDSLKKGPPKSRFGKTVVYERDSFLIWLASRLSKGEGGVDENHC